MYALNGNPELHMTAVVRLDHSIVNEYSARIRAYAKKRLEKSERFYFGLDMRYLENIDIDAQREFITKVGRIHEEIYESDNRYTQDALQKGFIFVPNHLIAVGLQLAVTSIFKPLIPLHVVSNEADMLSGMRA